MPLAMKTASLLLGSALLLTPALAHADDAPTAPIYAAPAPVYSTPSWVPVAPTAGFVPNRFAPTQRRSTGLLLGGIAVASLGTASLIGGAVMLSQAAYNPGSCPESDEFCFAPQLDSDVKRMGGTLLSINGGLMIAGGVAMALVGGWQVPVPTRASGSAAGAPTVAVGLGNATLRWSF